jgi:hypothetical protein
MQLDGIHDRDASARLGLWKMKRFRGERCETPASLPPAVDE